MEWFVTLTFSPDKVNRYDYDECGKKLSKWLRNCKQRCDSDFKYMVVPELHRDGAFHFHGLFASCSGLDFRFSGHKDSKGKDIYNIGRYPFGWTTATRVENNDAVTKYITKYVTKDLIDATPGKKRFWATRNLLKPEKSEVLLSYQDKLVLHEELVEDCRYKQVLFDVGFDTSTVEYYDQEKEQ